MRTRRAKRSAFNLLEMMLACMIFSTCVIMMSGIWVIHNSAVGRSRMLMIGTHVAEEVLQEAVAMGYKNLPDPPDTKTGTVNVNTTLRSTTFSTEYKWTRTITIAGGLGQLKSIQVVVEWQDGPNQVRKVNLETIVYDGT